MSHVDSSNLLQALFSFLYHRVEQLASAALESRRDMRVSEHAGMPDSEILFIVGPHKTSMLLLGGGAGGPDRPKRKSLLVLPCLLIHGQPKRVATRWWPA